MTDQSSTTDTATPAAAEFLEKLRNALRKDGDFPASAKVVGELRALVNDPKTTANQMTEVILREPALSLRILHLVNSSFYRRAKPIMTVSHAVVQIGMKSIAEMCAGMVLVQRFISVARRGGAFATCLQKTLVTSLLTSTVSSGTGGGEAGNQSANSSSKTDETGYLSGSMSELGALLLAYYFPQIYEAAAKRSETKRQDIGKSIAELTGLTPVQMSLEVITALDLPGFYRDAILASEKPLTPEQIRTLPLDEQASARAGRSLCVSRALSSIVTGGGSKQQMEATLAQLKVNTGVEPQQMGKLLGQLPEVFKDHCQSLDIQLPALPEYLKAFSDKPAAVSGASSDDTFAQFLDEIRASVAAGEPAASVITTVMETLAWSLKFDRVVLLLVGPGKKSLVGRMALGKIDGFDPRSFQRPLGDRSKAQHAEIQAYEQSRPIFRGEPLLEDGWPMMALPIGFTPRTIGVIYADRVAQEGDLSAREQAAVGVLAELLDRAVAGHA